MSVLELNLSQDVTTSVTPINAGAPVLNLSGGDPTSSDAAILFSGITDTGLVAQAPNIDSGVQNIEALIDEVSGGNTSVKAELQGIADELVTDNFNPSAIAAYQALLASVNENDAVITLGSIEGEHIDSGRASMIKPNDTGEADKNDRDVTGVKIVLSDSFFEGASAARKVAVIAGQNAAATNINAALSAQGVDVGETASWEQFSVAFLSANETDSRFSEVFNQALYYDAVHTRRMTNETPLTADDFIAYTEITKGTEWHKMDATEADTATELFSGAESDDIPALYAMHKLASEIIPNVSDELTSGTVDLQARLQRLETLLNDREGFTQLLSNLVDNSGVASMSDGEIDKIADYFGAMLGSQIKDIRTQLSLPPMSPPPPEPTEVVQSA